MDGKRRVSVWRWLSAARHPSRRDGVIATALLAGPWVLAWALGRHHYLDATTAAILASVTIPLSGLWLTWAAFRNANESATADRGIGPSGAVVANKGGIAIGQVVYRPRRGVTGKPVRLADPPPLLAGREKLLGELDARLNGGDGSVPQTVVLCGVGGVGKTSVALAYAQRHLAEVSVAWQFAAEDPMVLAAGFSELAAQLGARDDGDKRDPVASVHGTLAAFTEPWLLIFDNATDHASLEAVLPPAGPGVVLITSQNPLWPAGQEMDVPPLDTETGAQFLIARTGDRDAASAREVASELGGLPLALEQASAYIRATGGSIVRYLGLFTKRRAEMLALGEPIGYPRKVATAWALAFARLNQDAPRAAGLLQLLASCAPEPVPLDLLLQSRQDVKDEIGPELAPLSEDPLLAGDAVTALHQYSLVSVPRPGLVLMHRLVQAVTQDQMSEPTAAAWRQAAAAMIDAAIPEDCSQPDTWPDCALLLPHARAIMPAESAGTERLASYLGWSGSYSAARDLLQRVVDARERILGRDDPATVSAHAELALWTGEAGDPAGARDLSTALLPAAEQVFGPEHPKTLDIRFNLANTTGEAGNPAGARDQWDALVRMSEQVLGRKHPSTLQARHNFAYWTGEAGDPASARDHFAALLPAVEEVHGPEHEDTLAAREELGRWTGNAGDLGAASDQLRAVLAVRERVFGPEHPETLTVRHNLADFTGKAGDPAGARDQLVEVLAVKAQILGPEHPSTLTTRNILARYTGQAGDPAGARDQLIELVTMRQRVLGPEHPRTIASRAALACWTGEAGNPAGARDQFREILPIYEKVSGPEHPDVLRARADLARFTGEAGDAVGARDQFAVLVPLLEGILYPSHPDVLAAHRNVSVWTRRARYQRGPLAFLRHIHGH